MGYVISVSKSNTHTFKKYQEEKIILLKGLGVKGDAHMGVTIKHRSRVAKDPSQPNLRQVHLLHKELLDELKEKNFVVNPGQLGENITTQGIDILGLPKDSILSIGQNVKVKVTGLRNPCKQIDSIKEGLMQAVLEKDEDGNLIRKAGIMGIVLVGGEVKVGDRITIDLPAKPHLKLQRV